MYIRFLTRIELKVYIIKATFGSYLVTRGITAGSSAQLIWQIFTCGCTSCCDRKWFCFLLGSNRGSYACQANVEIASTPVVRQCEMLLYSDMFNIGRDSFEQFLTRKKIYFTFQPQDGGDTVCLTTASLQCSVFSIQNIIKQ